MGTIYCVKFNLKACSGDALKDISFALVKRMGQGYRMTDGGEGITAEDDYDNGRCFVSLCGGTVFFDNEDDRGYDHLIKVFHKHGIKYEVGEQEVLHPYLVIVQEVGPKYARLWEEVANDI